MMNGRILAVDPRILAHCRMCYEPMYYIYDQRLRDFCYECMVENYLPKGISYEETIQITEGNY
jgi:hypothetical protein